MHTYLTYKPAGIDNDLNYLPYFTRSTSTGIPMSLFAKPRKKVSKAVKPKTIEPTSPAPNQSLEEDALEGIHILRLSHEGRGVGRNAEGKTVFVEGALPDERVTYKVRFTRSRYDEAILDDVLQPSSQRQEPYCAHYAVCGGCSLQHLKMPAQVAFKQAMVAELMEQPADTFQPTLLSEPFGYRRKARMGVKWRKDGRLLLGFRERRSAFVTAITHCPVLSPQLQPLLPALNDFLPRLEGKKHLGHLDLIEGGNQLGLVVRLLRPIARLTAIDQRLWKNWAKEQSVNLLLQDDEGVHSLDTATQATLFNYQLDDLTLSFAANDFIQINASVNTQMVKQALNWLELTGNERVLDLFCGFGNFTLPLAKQAAEVLGVEGSKTQVKRATENALNNKLTNVTFVAADLNQPLKEQAWLTKEAAWDIVLLDPPRAGAEVICEQISSLGARKILYVSCNPATLARDTAILLQQGFKLQQLGIMDMFPQTGHVESMALFVQP